ncbi:MULTISPECIES: glutathione binding-like protein [Burkholderia]|uniref:Glutathione S-transferase n=1 Tax=Burkholderia contaminans TaxID=488447 RepID=A0A3N8Q978_9BURK|nr:MULTISPECIES: glutathione binding-like protein [Burkholderia]AOL07297.1 glutathione S-transferase [Burkholderia contaminans]ELK6465584.1 glutathione S-transferase N-terminal domain-containing protein [Burkholderia contaminans]MCA7887301.1 glutathione S-transferase N-terminal domain-containing protein [Burkholderia contaminans]RQT20205.1 glutathione S-transferase [Burkholderia contaminans]TCW65797.1 glutathione S-transferase [Burkholderia sp. SRS-25]
MISTHPLTFHTADTPNGHKIAIYLEEAGLAYDRVHVNLSAGEQRSPAFLAINPNGKIPAIVDHDAGLTVFESGAILSYLAAKTGVLHPDTLAERTAVQQWLHFQIGGIGPMLGQLWWFLHASTTVNAQALERYRNEVRRLYGVVNGRLAESAYLALPRYSIADIAAFPWLRAAPELDLDLADYPHVERWLAGIEARKAVQRGLIACRAPAAEGAH